MTKATCSMTDCSGPPLWRPTIDLRSAPGERPRRAHFLSVAMCEEHRKSSTISTFLSQEGFAKIAKHVAESGLPRPDHKLSTLEWEEVDPSDLDGPLTPIRPTPDASDDLAF
jgi:hypothetical protein